MEELTQPLGSTNRFYSFVFIHTPFCGTCYMARKMLHTIEVMWKSDLFYDMNASLFPDFMQTNKIESVPCLLICRNGEVKEKIYAFESVTKIYNFVMHYKGQEA